MSYTWKDALSKIGKQLNEKIEKSTIHIDDNVANLNGNITNVKNDITNVKGNIADINNSVFNINESITNLDNATKILRKFPPKFGSFMDTFPSGLRIKTTAEIKARLDLFKEIGIEEWVVQPWIIYNSTSGNLECNYDTNEMAIQINYAISIGITPSVLKIHLYDVPYSLITNTITIEKFKTQYKTIVLNLANSLKRLGIEYCIVFNENEDIYTNSDWDTYVLDIITSVQNLGYKVGISTMGIVNTTLMSDSILNKVDAFFGNTYPCISNKLQNTSYNDSVNAWNNDISINIFQYLKDVYKKPIIVSEVGIMDYWACLDNPGKWKWSDDKKIASNGKTEELVLYGLFNSCIVDIADKVWWCYDNLVGNEAIKILLNEYIGGIK